MRKLLLCFLVLFFSINLFCQESSDDDLLPLERETLQSDIETSDIEMLRNWCKDLGLDTDGNDVILRNRLMAWYNISGISQQSSEENSSNNNENNSTISPSKQLFEITIESAENSEYVQIEEKEGEEIHFVGDVRLVIKESDGGKTHNIQADRIEFSRITNSITARGNVIYTSQGNLDNSGNVSYGESLTIELDNWEGIIFKGAIVQESETDGEMTEFYFTGDTIKTRGSDLFILDKGTITSGDNWDNPDWKIKSGKIWIMGPGEWGIVNGVLYVGHIPVMYIPFYYKTGNELVFNPVIGTEDREGMFLQTTIYFFGQKPQNQSDDLLSFAPGSEQEYKTELNGLFLDKTEVATEPLDTRYFKLMIDWYAKLGFYTGIESSLAWPDIDWDLYFGIGVTRNINSNYDVQYTMENGSVGSIWNSSYLFGVEIPFRYALDTTFEWKNLELEWAIYSDPFFTTDFGSRDEDFDWLNWLLSDLTEDSVDSQGSTTYRYDWRITYRNLSFNTSSISPWISSINIPLIEASISWYKKPTTFPANTIQPENPNLVDPGREFFYPEKMVLPSMTFQMSGTLIDYPNNRNSENEIIDDETIYIDGIERPVPYDVSPDNESIDNQNPPDENSEMIEPELLPNANIVTNTDIPFSFKLSYNIDGVFKLEDYFDYASWSNPAEVDYKLEEAMVTLTDINNFNYALTAFNSIIDLKGTVTFSLKWRRHADIFGDSGTLTLSEKESDWSFSTVRIDNNTQLNIYPLKDVATLSQSRISYDLRLNFYEFDYTGNNGSTPNYEHQGIQWSSDYISRNELTAQFNFNWDIISASSKFSYNLLPDTSLQYALFENKISFSFWNMNHRISHTFSKSGSNDWDVNPLMYRLDFNPPDIDISAYQILSLDLERGILTKSHSNLHLFGLNIDYDMQYTTGYEWNNVMRRWDPTSERFQPTLLSFGGDWDIPFKPIWKDRITNKLQLGFDWDINLIQLNSNTLSYRIGYTFSIYEFLDITLRLNGANESMFLYFKDTRDLLGITENYNFFVDLLKAINIFSVEDRTESYFNMTSMQIDLTHNLRNWEAIISYKGMPELNNSQYEWKSEFSFYIKWNPIPQFNSSMEYRNNDWNVEAGK